MIFLLAKGKNNAAGSLLFESPQVSCSLRKLLLFEFPVS